MEFNAFDLILGSLQEELTRQGFKGPQEIEYEEGRAEMYKAVETAYGLFYSDKRQQFELKTAAVDSEGEPGEWRNLAVWLFDKQVGEKSDAVSIANDFLETIRGPRRVALIQQKSKKGKNEDRAIDPMFFLNRLANMFPEVKEAMKQERITYGQLRFTLFTKAVVVPIAQDLALHHPDSDRTEKLCGLFSEMYRDGDLDLRALISITLFNHMKEEAFVVIRSQLSDELKLDTKYTRKLIGKQIKPEKPKKEKKLVSRLDQ